MHKMFPIMIDKKYQHYLPKEMRWEIIAPHQKQAKANHSQTLERLAERGGLAPCEILAVLQDRPWLKMDHEQAINELADILEETHVCTGCHEPIKAPRLGSIVTMLGEKFYICVDCSKADHNE